MLLFITAFICSVVVLIAGLPSALNEANRCHIDNGREPDAGIAFMPDLIVMVLLWWGAAALLNHFAGALVAHLTVIVFSLIMLVYHVIKALESNREYAEFVAQHHSREAANRPSEDGPNKTQHHKSDRAGGSEA